MVWQMSGLDGGKQEDKVMDGGLGVGGDDYC
jgi:hypothetical protein